MTYQRLNRRLLAAPLALAVAACAGSDNPTALADLETAVEFEVSAAEIQTLEEVEFHIHVEERGMHLDLLQAELAIRHAGGEAIRTVALEQEGDEYRARVTFFEPGEHHVHVMGMPRGHGVMGEMGEFEVDVARRHEDIGPYWVEIATSPAGPLLEGQEAHIHIFVFDLLADGARGAPVTGLEFVAEMHHPHGTEMMLEVVEEAEGEYECDYTFSTAGIYELHVEIEVGAEEVSGEFHIPVFSPDADEPETQDDTGGHGHGDG
ncbi:MAG: FixH family protein [Gemmatimonadetes bacterium]|nr:FixH family protein [Gemmatimonadota bacterium]